MYFVLNLCIVLAFIKNGLILSKEQGGNWGIENLNSEFHAIIKYALQCYDSDDIMQIDKEEVEKYGNYMMRMIFRRNSMLEISYVTEKDKDFWFSLDKHLSESEFLLKIRDKRGYVIKEGDKPIGVMRYNLFWDIIPFLTLIYFDEAYRGKGYGTKVMLQWESEMCKMGHKIAMTSTMVEETSQNFYRKLGYKDCGCLIKDMPPFIETMEMFMMKQISS